MQYSVNALRSWPKLFDLVLQLGAVRGGDFLAKVSYLE